MFKHQKFILLLDDVRSVNLIDRIGYELRHHCGQEILYIINYCWPVNDPLISIRRLASVVIHENPH